MGPLLPPPLSSKAFTDFPVLTLKYHPQMFLLNFFVNHQLLLVFRVLPLWVGARGIEFDWKYIQLSLDSNVSLVSDY